MHPKNVWNEMISEGSAWESLQKYYCNDEEEIKNLYKVIYEQIQSFTLHEDREEEQEEEITLEDVEYYPNEVILTYSNDAKVYMDPNDYVENSQIIADMPYEEVIREYAIEVLA